MLKNIVGKALAKKQQQDLASDAQTSDGNKTNRLNRVSDLAVNEALQRQPLIDAEEERMREIKFKNDHVDYLRVTRKPLQFGIEEAFTYKQHSHLHIQGCLQNFNNLEYGTWDQKSLHMWSMETGCRTNHMKLLEVTKTHSAITACAFSHKYRLYLVVTSHFKFIFLNEHFSVVTTHDMSTLSTVNFVHWNDGQNQLITAGIKGVFIFNFKYTSKYNPKLAATIDVAGKYIGVEFLKKRLLDPILPWVKGMKVDVRNSIIMTWSQGQLPGAAKGGGGKVIGNAVTFNKASVCFNWLNSRAPSGNDNGSRPEQEVDEQTMNKTIDALRKMISGQKLNDGIVEGTNEVIKCIEEKTILVVILASDITDQKFLKHFNTKAAECSANVIEIGTRDDLGVWLGLCRYDKHKNPIKIQPTPCFALAGYGDEFESYQIIKKFIKQQRVMKQNQTGDLIALFKDIMDYGEQILDVLVFIEYRYFLVSTDEGNIYVFKYVQSGKVEQQKKLIHTYSGHAKHCSHMSQVKGFPHLFMSVSLDGTTRVWSLESFSHLYTIEIPGSLSFVRLLSRCDFILSQTSDHVQLHNLHMILENYMNAESQVMAIDRAYYSLTDKDEGTAGFTISICQDNSAVIKDINCSSASFDKTTLYPPPSAQTIEKIVFATSLDRLILLLSSSTICIYKRVKETALLERIMDPSEIKDCEMKRAFSQSVTCMETFHTDASTQILPFDTEVLNVRLHESVLSEALNDPNPQKEFIVLGLNKGAVLLFHVAQLSQLYCRFTVHREEIKAIKYLPSTKSFVSFCSEGYLSFWQISLERKVQKLCTFRMPAEKKMAKIHLVALNYYRHNEDETVPSDRILIIFQSGESEMFDFELDDNVVRQEGEDYNGANNAHLYLVENEKQKEHDSTVTGVDSSKYVRLIVTSDSGGSIKLWSLEKRFMREIVFPHPIDSVCFLNQQGDILVSHVQRISKIRYDAYWTSSFTHFGFTSTADPIHVNYKEKEATIETEFFDDHVCLKQPPTRTRVINEDHFSELFRTKNEEDHQSQANMLTFGGTVTSNLHQMIGGKAMDASKKKTSLLSGFTDAFSNQMENALSRLGGSAMQSKLQPQKNPFSSVEQLPAQGSSLRNKISAFGGASYLSKHTAESKMDKAGSQIQHQQPQNLQSQQLATSPAKAAKSQTQSVPARSCVRLQARRKSSMTAYQLQDKLAQQERLRLEEHEQAEKERQRKMNGPGARDAVPREQYPMASRQVLQPLPGVSYLSTSPVYYEMLAKRKKQKGQLSKGQTRRKITENRISSNIMNFNAPTAVNDFSDMELSIDYNTQVSQHKYAQSNFLPLMNLQILSRIPIEQILNPNYADQLNAHTMLNQGMRNTDMTQSTYSRKSKSNMPFRANSFGGHGASERASRNTDRSGKETVISHLTQGSNRHSLVKPIGLDGQQVPNMMSPNNQAVEMPSNARKVGRSGQRTNIMMTGNQIVGGNLSYPRTTRNVNGQKIQLNTGPAENNSVNPHQELTSISHFETSVMQDGGRNKPGALAAGSFNNQVTDTSFKGQSSILSSDMKPREGVDNYNSQMPHHPSQTTQETSKQVFIGGKGTAITGASRAQENSMLNGELTSIGEDNSVQRQPANMPINEGLEQDDSIIGHE